MAEENRRGFHNTASQGHDHNRGGSVGGEGRGGERKAMKEPSNHSGHTYEMARRGEHDRRVEAVRNAHQLHHHAAPGGAGEAQRQQARAGESYGSDKRGAATPVRGDEER